MEIRSLIHEEKEVIKQALELAAKSKSVHPLVNAGAKLIINQNMIEDLLWVSKK